MPTLLTPCDMPGDLLSRSALRAADPDTGRWLGRLISEAIELRHLFGVDDDESAEELCIPCPWCGRVWPSVAELRQH